MPGKVRVAGGAGRKQVLLCIDDNEIVLSGHKAFLEAFGYSVLIAASGRTGLDLATRRKIDLVILDYEMPEMSGGEVAARLRHLRPGVPILLLSGVVNIPEQVFHSCDASLMKGEAPSRLLAMIADLVGPVKFRPQSQPVSCRRRKALRG